MTNPASFISALSIDWENEAGVNPSRIVVVSSASKDFTMNGLRLGTLVCQHNPLSSIRQEVDANFDQLTRFNRQFVSAMKATAKLAMVSSAADALWSSILLDDQFLTWFIETNRERLSDAYGRCKAWLKKMQIDYTPSNAGHFLLIDLSRFLPKELDGTKLDKVESETALWAKVCRCQQTVGRFETDPPPRLAFEQILDHGVALTPGFNSHHPTTGVFRLTFSLEPIALDEGLRRLEEALADKEEIQIVPSSPMTAAGTAPGTPRTPLMMSPGKEGFRAMATAASTTTSLICAAAAAAGVGGSGEPQTDASEEDQHDAAIRSSLSQLRIAAACSACCC